MRPKEVLRLVKEAAKSWSEDYVPSMGAALAYYTLFSVAPLLIVVIAVAGLVFGDQAARGEIFAQLQELMGEEGARAVEGLLQAADKPREGLIAGALGGVVLLIGATTVFGELQNALDRIWRAPARTQSSGLWTLLRTRLLSFGMILGIAFLLMVSLVLSAALAGLGRMWALPGWETLAHVLDIALSFGLTTLLFALIYKLIPRTPIAWRDVWVGAAVTAALFAVGKFLIGLYLGKSAIASSYGAAGSLVVFMVWVYYSAQIFLFGAEFTWVYAHEHGSRRGQSRSEPSVPPPASLPASPARGGALVPVRPGTVSNAPQYHHPGRGRVPRNFGKHPYALLGGAFAAGLALAVFRKRIVQGAAAGAAKGVEALKRRAPLASRRRRILAALGR